MTRIWSEFRIYAVITQFVNNKDASSNLPAFDVLVTLQNDVTRSRNCSRSNILKWMANAKFAHRASNSVCIRETCCTCTYHRKPNAVIMMTSVGKTFLTEIRVVTLKRLQQTKLQHPHLINLHPDLHTTDLVKTD